MQNTSATYRRIVSKENHWFETRLVIGESGRLINERGLGITFGGTGIVVARSSPESGFTENILFSVNTTIDLFGGNPTIGTTPSAEIDVEMLNPSGDIPRMSVVIPYVRTTDGEEYSEWIQQGMFFIDTREISHNDDGLDMLSFHGLDTMMKAEKDYAETSLDWPAKDIDVVREIAEQMGVSVDPRTIELMTEGYELPLMTSYTLRETLGYIASMYVGCFIMSDIGELRLVTLTELPEETRYLTDNAGYTLVFGADRILV